jgi:hypothetical protein
VKGKVVGMPVFDNVRVTEPVYDVEVVMDFVKGKVVGIPVFDNVRVTEPV